MSRKKVGQAYVRGVTITYACIVEGAQRTSATLHTIDLKPFLLSPRESVCCHPAVAEVEILCAGCGRKHTLDLMSLDPPGRSPYLDLLLATAEPR